MVFLHKKFKEHDLVIMTQGEFKGIEGKVVDDEAPILWVMMSNTKEVINVHEKDLELIK